MINTVIDEIFLNTEEYQNQFSKDERKNKGQFFTSKLTAMRMASYLKRHYFEATIMEPGAGNGALAAAVILKLIDDGCKKINCILIENDLAVLPLLRKNILIINDYAKKHNVSIAIDLKTNNFILDDSLSKVDIIIMNPPYKKIRKDSAESRKMNSYVFGQPNLYSLFMSKAVNLLKDKGEFVFIVPRSWTSGEYYKISRKFILDSTDIKNICIFNDRDNSFSSEEVLQETMIYSGEKKEKQTETITIDVSEDDNFEKITSFKIESKIIKNIGLNNYLLIPSNTNEILVLKKFSKATKSFKDMGYEFKTGPVVEFRNKDLISVNKKENYVPMFRSANIMNGNFSFPVLISKAQYISVNAKKLLIKNNSTIFIRRLSSKEEKRRLQCCIYTALKGIDLMSIENHVNYLTKVNKQPITDKELKYIFSLLMSDEYDAYFRLMNGNTQVNVKELNDLPYIELEKNNEKKCK